MGVCFYFNDELGHSNSASGKEIVSFFYWPIVQDTGAPITHDKPGSLTYPIYGTDTREHCYENNQYLSSFSIFIDVRGSNSQSLGRQASVSPLSQAPS